MLRIPQLCLPALLPHLSPSVKAGFKQRLRSPLTYYTQQSRFFTQTPKQLQRRQCSTSAEEQDKKIKAEETKQQIIDQLRLQIVALQHLKSNIPSVLGPEMHNLEISISSPAKEERQTSAAPRRSYKSIILCIALGYIIARSVDLYELFRTRGHMTFRA